MSERSLALGSGRHLRAKSLPQEGILGVKNLSKNEPRQGFLLVPKVLKECKKRHFLLE
jgi:hypothetical protein